MTAFGSSPLLKLHYGFSLYPSTECTIGLPKKPINMEIPLDFVHPRFLKRKDSLLSSVPCSFDQLKAVLSKPAPTRSESDLQALLSFTRNIKFFAELREKAGEGGLLQCCRKLRYETCSAGKVKSR